IGNAAWRAGIAVRHRLNRSSLLRTPLAGGDVHAGGAGAVLERIRRAIGTEGGALQRTGVDYAVTAELILLTVRGIEKLRLAGGRGRGRGILQGGRLDEPGASAGQRIGGTAAAAGQLLPAALHAVDMAELAGHFEMTAAAGEAGADSGLNGQRAVIGI